MDLSVIIPTYRRHEKLAHCLRNLAQQTLAHERYEVLVGFDGPDPLGEAIAREAWESAGAPAPRLVTEHCPRGGLTQVRNQLLAKAQGRIFVSTNDDVRPEPGFLEAHLAAHREAGERIVVVVGDSPWLVHQPDRLFDRLVRETSMVFFGGQLAAHAHEPTRDVGFRNAYGLNTSFRTDIARSVNFYTVLPAWYGYEDIEIAFKLNKAYGHVPVWHRAGARLFHDHIMEPLSYLEREYRLGFAAFGFAQTAPDCARATFGRDIAEQAEADYSQAYLEREAPGVKRLVEPFVATANLPADSIAGPHAAALVNLIYQQHLPLKRFCWRAGLLDARARKPLDVAGLLTLLEVSPAGAPQAAR